MYIVYRLHGRIILDEESADSGDVPYTSQEETSQCHDDPESLNEGSEDGDPSPLDEHDEEDMNNESSAHQDYNMW